MIDWARVNTLRDEIGPEDFNEVVALFLDEVDEVMERLVNTPDQARLMEDLHFLKGSALNLGFVDLGVTCQRGERMAAEGQAVLFDVGTVIALYAASRSAFEAGIANARRIAG